MDIDTITSFLPALAGETWSLPLALAAFAVAVVLVAACGVPLTDRAERLARATGLGQALVGALFIGAVTSLAGLTASLAAAHAGHASLAVSNSLGGIAVQTTFLALADMAWRRANLEHAAASEPNMMQAVLLMGLLALPLAAMARPDLVLGGVHVVSPLMLLGYVFGLKLVAGAQSQPMWTPRQTRETVAGEGDSGGTRRGGGLGLWLAFLGLAAGVALAGWLLSRSGPALAEHLGLGESLVGGVLVAVSTSLPELVIALAAVRRGFLALAVGDILGGNAFDVLFLAGSDLVHPGGTVYAAIGSGELFWLALTLVLVAVLLAGMLRRERHGVGNIGFESALVLAFYAAGVVVVATT